MKKIFSILLIILIGISTKLIAEDSQTIKRISEGEENAKITIIAYESLTCGHCADFHKNVYPDLKKNFIEKGLVKIQFRHFPLDIAALPNVPIKLPIAVPAAEPLAIACASVLALASNSAIAILLILSN